jgi:chromosome segregation ATPase
MAQLSFLQSLLDKAHADIASRSEEIIFLKGEYDSQKSIVESLKDRLSEMTNEKTKYQAIIRDLTTDKESFERKCQQLEASMQQQNILIQESDVEKIKLKKDLDSVKALSRKLLNDMKEASKGQKEVPVDTVQSKSANKKKKSKTMSATAGSERSVESSLEEQLQILRDELSVMKLEKETHAQVEDDMIRDFRGQVGQYPFLGPDLIDHAIPYYVIS